MKDIILTIITVLTLFAAGCSHNANFVASGKVFKIGTEAAGLLYVNGLVAINGTRENSESIIEAGDDDGLSGAPTVDAKTVRTIRFRTGPQLTGYLVDLAKKDSAAAEAYVKVMPKLNTNSWDSKETLNNKSNTRKDGEKTTTSDYIEMLKAKLASISGGASMPTLSEIKGDGEYNNLYADRSITAQAALTAELLKYADDTTEMPSSGETIKDTLVHYAGRLAQLKAKGKSEATKITLGRATITGGKLTYLMYRLREDDATYKDEECPSCFELED